MEANTAHFACHKCGKPYDWSPEIVGKTAKCACGTVLKIPSAPPGTAQANQEAAYKAPNPGCLVPQSPEVSESIPPLPGEPQTAHAAIISLYQPVSSAGRTRAPMELADEELDPKIEAELNDLAQYGDKEEEQKKPNPYLDHHLPLILLGVGLMLMFGQASFIAHRHHESLFASLFGVTFSLIINIIFMIIAMGVAAKFTGIYFGKIPTAILKIAAIYVAPTTLGNGLADALGGDMPYVILGGGISIVLYWTLLSYLFRLDGSQTMACVVCISILSMLTKLFLVGAMLAALGTSMGEADRDAIDEAQSLQLHE
jgi:hypothetical protein